MNAVKILAFSGSSRKDSYNKKLVQVACREAESLGAEVTYIDTKEYPLPLYDGDVEEEQGLPENAKKIRELMKSHNAFIISTPEYNGALSGLLKNIIDWTSRGEDGKGDLSPYKNKQVLIMSASPGRLGGIRGLLVLQYILSKIGADVLSTQISFPEVQNGFDENGAITNTYIQESLRKATKELIDITTRLTQ